MRTTKKIYPSKLLLGCICSSVLVCISQLLPHTGKVIAGQQQGIIKIEQVKEGFFNVTYRRRWEENYYQTDVYQVDCSRRLATFKGSRHLPLVSEEYLINKVCDTFK